MGWIPLGKMSRTSKLIKALGSEKSIVSRRWDKAKRRENKAKLAVYIRMKSEGDGDSEYWLGLLEEL